ncbi:hypothetical protein Ocin01_02683 [Orchesella cincta]|uniref:CUB domain-containing protein n=1 Tax=Orchesella cincta TaxID=48709 RepID=A0A1D2NFK3_ORCCI|nr:hypothetical protein Ocin01_02683 [Orchesella cincta]
MSKLVHAHLNSLRNMRSIVWLIFFVSSMTESIPISNHYCPVPTTSSELGTQKVLDLHDIKGHKVRLQFFYPSEEASRKLLESASQGNSTNKTFHSVETDSEEEAMDIPSPNSDAVTQDVYCQWTFRAGNASQFLSLTFEKLSAPYSDNCVQAFVALQKENGYESRWCGNRRQAHARPMSLLARSSAVVTVYRSGNAPLLPVTGFKVSVRELDVGSLQGAESSLRVLHG